MARKVVTVDHVITLHQLPSTRKLISWPFRIIISVSTQKKESISFK